jgi:hypothetical protein
MKKGMMIILCLIAAAMQASATVYWYTDGGDAQDDSIDLVDWNGDTLALDSGITFYLAEQTGTGTTWADFDIDNAHSVSYSTEHSVECEYSAGQFWDDTFSVGVAQESATYYTLIASDIAGEYVVLENDSYTFGDSAMSFAANINIYISDVSANDWQAIPEPSTVLIFLFGSAGLLGFRRLRG